jgi:DNA polymerase III alpha subunit
MAEAIRLGIVIRPPHVNTSGERFTLTLHEGKKPTLWMGLGAVRDLRRSTIERIVRERESGPYADLRDLLGRVEPQARETTHLIQCGALDGLGTSRADLLGQAAAVGRSGVSQLSFGFDFSEVESETPAQRLEWERSILGQPVSVHPLEVVAGSLSAGPSLHLSTTPLREVPGTAGRTVTIAGVRLPGWTGGPGYFLGDSDSFVIVRSEKRPESWQPVLVRGRWQRDAYGSGWFQADEWHPVLSQAARP